LTPDPAGAKAALAAIALENPDEPFFSGLVSMAEKPDGLQLVFAEAHRPVLLPIVNAAGPSPASVACHLYAGLQPAADDTDVEQ